MICAIVLAAGESRRMGTHKVLLPFGEKTVIAHIVDELLASTVDGTWVVVGYQGNRVAEELSGRSVSLVTNPNYEAGMLSSVRCGLRALPRECEAVLVVLSDQPAIMRELINDMVRAFGSTDRGILIPVHHGKRGHPLLFSFRYRDEILSRYDDVGLCGLLRAHPDDVVELNVASPSILSDMDYPENYRQQLAQHDRNRRQRQRPPNQ